MGQPPASFLLTFVFLITNFTEKTVGFSGNRTQIIRFEGELRRSLDCHHGPVRQFLWQKFIFNFQVKYLQSCISVSVDFVSPENLSHSCHLVRQFRYLPERQLPPPEDRFQFKNLVFHSVKRALSVREKKNKKNGKFKVNDVEQTNVPNIYAIGDVIYG